MLFNVWGKSVINPFIAGACRVVLRHGAVFPLSEHRLWKEKQREKIEMSVIGGYLHATIREEIGLLSQ